MTEQSFEYKALRFLNDRFELYNITDQTLKIALYDFTENDYNQGIDSLRKAGYVKNKELYQKGLSITTQGQTKLQQLQRVVDNEKKETKSFWERTSPIRDTIGTAGTIAAIYFGWLTISNDNKSKTLETEVRALNDSIYFYGDENKNLRDSILFLDFEMKKQSEKKDSVAEMAKP